MDQDLIRSMFTPRRIALIGASGDASKNTSRPQRFLRKHGYDGEILPINPTRGEVLGERTYASLRDVSGPIDHALIMVPAKAVADAIAECCDAHVPVVTILSDGFADQGEEGHRQQQALVARARQAGVRVIGPNSMGLIDTRARMTLCASAVLEGLELQPGSLGLVSQSGTMLGALLSRAQARGFGFSRMVAVGNEADLTVGEIVDALVDDPQTKTILIFLETLRGADHLAAAARRAHLAGKPIVAYKLGKSDVGRELAASHTGALAGPQRNVSAFFRHHGIIEVECLETLVEIAPLLAGRRPQPRGKVAVVTTTGGGAAMVVDRLGALGIELTTAPVRLIERLKTDFKIHIGASRVIDLTLAGTRKDVCTAALEELMASPDCDAVITVVGASGMFHPQHAVEPILAVKGTKPIAAFVAPQADQSLAILGANNIAAFRTPEACADAMNAFLKWTSPAVSEPENSGDRIAAQRVLAHAAADRLREDEALRLFGALGIRQAATQVLDRPDSPVTLSYPVVAKILSADILHKTDAGGVALNLADAASVRQAAERILATVKKARPDAKLQGLLLQEMERGSAEVILGFKRDPEVGPIVMVGMGGVLAEIYQDVAVRLAPVDRGDALSMIDEVQGFAVLRGYRGLPKGDLDALADAICAFSQLANLHGADILEAEINPLIVKGEGQGVVAVDGVVLSTSRQGGRPRLSDPPTAVQANPSRKGRVHS